MTKDKLLSTLKSIYGTGDSDVVLSTYLDIAGEKILNKCYPYRGASKLDVPSKYHSLQIEIAMYLLDKRGAEGQTIHKENGVDRTYESASVPDSMLKEVVPFVKAL